MHCNVFRLHFIKSQLSKSWTRRWRMQLNWRQYWRVNELVSYWISTADVFYVANFALKKQLISYQAWSRTEAGLQRCLASYICNRFQRNEECTERRCIVHGYCFLFRMHVNDHLPILCWPWMVKCFVLYDIYYIDRSRFHFGHWTRHYG